MRRRPRNQEPCLFYLQGKCDRGDRCRFSHEGFYRATIVRHAQSLFNRQADKYPGNSFFDEPAVTEFQLNEDYIDCPLSEEGIAQCQNTTLNKNRLPPKIDVVFVSPLNRTLETATLILKHHQVEPRRVIVLPELTEVLSKICDFGGDVRQKRQKYENFDFMEMERFVKENKLQNEEEWQDVLVDRENRRFIKTKEVYGRRYLRLLKDTFPTPLESSERCFGRAMRSLDIIKELSDQLEAKSILIVSHNRILKYFCGRFNKGRASSLANCEMREMMF